MLKKLIITSLVIFYGSSVQAGLVVETFGQGANATTLGGYEMFDFDLGSSTFTSPNNPLVLDGTINGDATNITLESSVVIAHGKADDVGLEWWNNHVDDGNYDVFNVAGTNWINIILPDNTVAFSLNIGANKNAHGWFTALDNNSMGLTNNNGLNGHQTFAANTSASPGFGIYAQQSNPNECTTITSVLVDPNLIWGIGNFSANTGGCATVPEPSIIALFGLGLVGLGFARRRQA